LAVSTVIDDKFIVPMNANASTLLTLVPTDTETIFSGEMLLA